MCQEIHYLYPSCLCLAKVGKYACYIARNSSSVATSTASTTNADDTASTTSSSSGSVTPRNPFSDDNAIVIPEITITSSSDTTDLFGTYNNALISAFATTPLSLSSSKINILGNDLNNTGANFTIRTLLSNRIEDVSQIDHLGISKFNVQCERFKITEQVMRTGMEACSRCWERIAREDLVMERMDLERLQSEGRGESYSVEEMGSNDVTGVQTQANSNNETIVSEAGGLGSEGTRDEGSHGGLRDMDEIERELRGIQRYTDGFEGDNEDGESWESFNDDDEAESLIAAAGAKRPGGSLGRRRSNSR